MEEDKATETSADYRVIRHLDRSEEPSAWTDSYLAISPKGQKVIISYLNKDKIISSYHFDAEVDQSMDEKEEEILKKAEESYEKRVEEFKRSANFAKGVNHPHIARVYDVGFDKKRGEYLVVRECISGLPLYNATRGLSPVQMIPLWIQVLKALSYLHSKKGVLHLNIKSKRVVAEVRDNGTYMVKLTDCGYAIPIEEARKTGVARGTPAYISREAALGENEKLGPQSDLQSFGILMYYCVTGSLPFPARQAHGRSFERLSRMIREEELPLPPSAINERCPHALSEIIMNLLQKEPCERVYKSAAAVISAFRKDFPDACKEEALVEETITIIPQVSSDDK